MKQVKCSLSEVAGTCGLGLLRSFETSFCRHTKNDIASYYKFSGTGFFVAGFVNEGRCKRAYKFLTSNFKLIYQSPVRVNTNTDRQFFFCIFDSKD